MENTKKIRFILPPSTGLPIILLLMISLIIACATATDRPADHDVKRGGVWHRAGLYEPEVNCTACHGADLRGSDTAPSCFICHDQKW